MQVTEPRIEYPTIDVGRGITLAYDTIGDRCGDPLVMITGIGQQLINWPQDLCELLADAGFFVIRFDNRDAGQSTRGSAKVPGLIQLGLRQLPKDQYDLRDMALDTVGLLDALGIQAAHFVGWSMGGMISQTLAVHHPERVLSLTSYASGTGHPIFGLPDPRVIRAMFTPPKQGGRQAMVDQSVRVWKAYRSPKFAMPEEEIAAEAGLMYDRGFRAAGLGRHIAAVLKAGNRTRELRKVKAPTLVVHGDKDTLIHVSGGKATAKAIPGAKLQIVEGMGHDLPRQIFPDLVKWIRENADR